jgi:mRNA interferase RelE/StbE
MGSYRLEVRASVQKDLRRLPRADLERILSRIADLATDPRPPGCERLSGVPLWRIRQGDYRILYEVLDEVVTVIVVRVAHRREAYR